MKKSIIVLLVIVVLVFVLVFINGLKPNTKDSKKLENYLEKNGYVLEEQSYTNPETNETSTSRIYHKQISKKSIDDYLEDYDNKKNSEYEEFFFDIDSYSLIKVKMKYEDEVSTVFKAEKKLDKDFVTYNYEVSVLSSTIMLNGTYKTGETAFDAKNLTCDVAYTILMDEEEKDTYCSISKFELLTFLEDVNNFTDSQEIKEIIDNGPTKK